MYNLGNLTAVKATCHMSYVICLMTDDKEIMFSNKRNRNSLWLLLT